MATAPKAAKAEATSKRYTVLVPVHHDQEAYAPGEPIDLTDDHAKPLLDCKAVEPAKATA